MQKELFLPPNYRENKVISIDSHKDFWDENIPAGELLWQQPVYKFTAAFAEKIKPKTIVDIGCGTGHKLAKFLSDKAPNVVGFDQPSGTRIGKRLFPQINWQTGDLNQDEAWERLKETKPDLILCSDVIEHLEDPVSFLKRVHQLMENDGYFILSTPDRQVFMIEGDATELGPPRNPLHVREWAFHEMKQLLEVNKFKIIEHHHLLPKGYAFSIRTLGRIVTRLLKFRPPLDRKYNMLFVCQKG